MNKIGAASPMAVAAISCSRLNRKCFIYKQYTKPRACCMQSRRPCSIITQSMGKLTVHLRLADAMKFGGALALRYYRTAAIVFSLGIFAVYLTIVIIQMLHHALEFDGFAMNGAFQALNPLRRLSDGQVIGRDFQFFHGLGIPLLHYPFYWLLGSDLTASEVARWMLQPLLFAASTVIFFRAVTRRWWVVLLASSLTLFFCLLKLPAMVYPENSSLGLRALVPVLLMSVILVRQKLASRPVGRYLDRYQLACAGLLTAGFLCGTEQGIAAAIAFTIVSLSFAAGLTFKQRLVYFAKTAGLATVATFTLLTFVTLGHPLRPLHFALVDLPADQGWFFGAPPNTFLEYSNIVSFVTEPFIRIVIISSLVLVGLLFWLRRRPFVADRLEGLTFGLLTGAVALAAVFGYSAATQFIPLARMSLLTVLALGIGFVAWLSASLTRKYRKQAWPKAIVPIAALLVAGYTASIADFMVDATNAQFKVLSLAKLGYNTFVTKTNSEALGTGWQATMRQAMPIINADNYATIAPRNDGGFRNGVSLGERAIAVRNDQYAPLLKRGQVVYLPISGRHRVLRVETNQQATTVYLEASHDINANDSRDGRIIIGERLDKSPNHIWSTYTALFESEMNTMMPTPGYDYIIHALGPEAREEYVRSFDKAQPEFVVTMRRSYSFFEEWTQYTSWDFYQRIVSNYEPAILTASHLIWRKKPDQTWQQTDYKQQAVKLPINNNSIKLPPNLSDKPQLITVTVSYRTEGLTPKLPLLSKSPRYLLAVNNTTSVSDVTLPPYYSQRSFPVLLKPHTSDGRLDAVTRSLAPGAQLQLTAASYQAQSVGDGTIQALLDQGGPLKP